MHRFENEVSGSIIAGTAATAAVTCAGVQLGDSVTIEGVAFTAAGGAANPANQEFDETAGTDVDVAASLALTINDAASQILLDAANPTLTGITAANGGTATVTLTAVPVGAYGNALTLASSTAVRLALSGALFTGGVDAGAAVTVAQITADFIACSVHIRCPTGTAASLDYVIQASCVRAPADVDDWTQVANGTVAAGAEAFVHPLGSNMGVFRHVRTVISRNGAGATAYRVAAVGIGQPTPGL